MPPASAGASGETKTAAPIECVVVPLLTRPPGSQLRPILVRIADLSDACRRVERIQNAIHAADQVYQLCWLAGCNTTMSDAQSIFLATTQRPFFVTLLCEL
jgi:hypothetical protein